MSPDALNSLFSLCIGFALAGALASGYQALVQRPGGFWLAAGGRGAEDVRRRAVPGVCRALHHHAQHLRGARIERRRFEFVMMATVLAGFWSLMSGTFFLMTLRAAGLAGLTAPNGIRIRLKRSVAMPRSPEQETDAHGDLRT